ncbi:MAG: P-loop NTPase [Desulfobacula sp.]|jgi:MinD superfamily P-loop ATPase|uniref:ATP-binding protein n=1 Tax=Desulfobacula sp. TaxID=2593537 RepID=UPI001DCF398C|nr:P-loop NTPase [Desulfobacula sp.]MBT3486701.1 P-loop NTPase [Desulfobacula sp.]MBT3805121.1 P-loop NTPase [Desulfobacula sp.]MBT4026039.1 P-loop NTPase [Desulfobacula sp.]MBT4199796.1 P-loop NTPase [Desulfobacula sp.]
MIISIASGKGGTGKTTVATNLAFSLGKNVQIMDCDVEEPNSHLFLKPEIRERQAVIAPIPLINEFKCSYCKKCMEICRFGAIAVVGKKIITFPELCHSCGGCMAVCPEDAILENDRELGEIETGSIGDISFIHGRLKVGQVMSPPIIKKIRTLADKQMVNIIDAPPGTSCPVIAAMKGADFVLLVTEPTPFGLHDLTLAVETIKILNIPHGIVINRAGLGNNDVKEYAKKEGIPILMEIPFDKKIAQVYSRGELIVEKIPEYKDKFLDLFDQIKNLVNNLAKSPVKDIADKGAATK